jgi:hypothetical protein
MEGGGFASGVMSFSTSKCLQAVLLCAPIIAGIAGCDLFRLRSPETPEDSGPTFPPATEPLTVIANLEQAIALKNVQNYVVCFADATSGPRTFSFIPSADGSALYGSVFRTWSITEEQAYFQNITARTTSTSVTNLSLTQKSQFFSADSAVLDYDYILTIEHTDPTFPKTARGSLEFALQRNPSTNIWTIYRWTDIQTPPDTSWSLFKGKFSN